jgi:hypothetical protein
MAWKVHHQCPSVPLISFVVEVVSDLLTSSPLNYEVIYVLLYSILPLLLLPV